MRSTVAAFAALAACGLLWGPATAQESVTRLHGITLIGDLKYGPDFEHWAYVNPDAPKGGQITQFSIGDFDSLNPYILTGRPASGLGLMFETLFTSNLDELSAQYGLIAEWMEFPEDLSWVTFKVRDEARWHDGTPITVDDVIFSLDILKTKGHPFYSQYFENLGLAEDLGDNQVRIYFDTTDLNRELPTIAGQLPVLSKAYWSERNFGETTLEIPMGSGPYRIRNFDAPSSITYERNENYWGADLPVNVGQNNFDVIRIDYYLDQTIALEAFKAGEYDFRSENNSKMWAVDYESPALEQGLIVKALIDDKSPSGMQGFFLNTRQAKFTDRKVREALQYVFDFEWTNNTLFYGQYTRTRSYFENSELAAQGVPGPLELEYLEPFRGQIPDEVFTTEFRPPASDGSGNNRDMLVRAQQLLAEAGWTVSGGRAQASGAAAAGGGGIDGSLAGIALLLLVAAVAAYALLRGQGSGLRYGATIILAGGFVIVGYSAMQGDGGTGEQAGAGVGGEASAGRLVNAAGDQMAIEFLLVSPAFERIVGPVVQNLQRLGIAATQRTVDTSQYQERVQTFDFDVVVSTMGQSLSPGNEQRDFWSCNAAQTDGSRNIAGICSPVVDRLIDQIIAAPDRERLVASTMALDRVLQWGYYVVPNWHIRSFRVAYWDKFGRPEVTPAYGVGSDTWWIDPGKDAAIRDARARIRNN